MRDYKDEYKKFQSSNKEKKNRAKRNKVRLKYLKLGKVKKGDNKDVHHTNGINNDSVEVMSSSKNKGMPNEGGRKKNIKKRKYIDGGVSAPKGFHWMKKGMGKYKLMEHGDKPFKKHEGASLKAEFPIQKKHNPKQDAKMAKKKYKTGGQVFHETNDKEGYKDWKKGKTPVKYYQTTNISPSVLKEQVVSKPYEDQVQPGSKEAQRKENWVYDRNTQDGSNRREEELLLEKKGGKDIKKTGFMRGLFNRKTEKGLVKKKFDDELYKDSKLIEGARTPIYSKDAEKSQGREQLKFVQSGTDSDGNPMKMKWKKKGIKGRDIPTEMGKSKRVNKDESKFVSFVDGKRIKKRGESPDTAREYKRKGFRRVYVDPDAEGNVQYVGTNKRSTKITDKESSREQKKQQKLENKAIREQKKIENKAIREQKRKDFRSSFGSPSKSYSSSSGYGDYKEGGGLWANIHAKRKRIAAGSGEKMRKPGSPGAPTAKALKESKAEEGAVVFNKPKRTPNHPKKSHMVIVRKPGGGKKTIRFGQQGVTTAGKPKEGESQKQKNRRKSFKARHRKNIAKGKLSAAYWADKVKW